MKAKINPTIMDGVVVRWNVDPDNHHRGEISASRNAVMVTGSWTLSTMPEFLEFERVLRSARQIADRIAKASVYLARPDVATVRGWVVALGFEVLPEKGFGAP